MANDAPASDLVSRLRDYSPENRAHVVHQAADEIERLRRIEQLALIWSSYQEDDSQLDQQTDPHLKAQANEAARQLFEALI